MVSSDKSFGNTIIVMWGDNYVLGLVFVSLATVLHCVNFYFCRVLVCLHHSELAPHMTTVAYSRTKSFFMLKVVVFCQCNAKFF
jgi:hypothetical protein